MNINTTFKELRERCACEARYRHLARSLGGIKKYGEKTPISIVTILDSNGVEDAEWAMGNCPSLCPLWDDYWEKLNPLQCVNYRQCAELIRAIVKENEGKQ